MGEQNRREAKARELGEQIAALLTQIEDLDCGPVVGQITIPGARIRRTASGWDVTS
ncbi:hypothetical protein [Streptomyces omiyaensis]|uniref:hypothetical protein n=1 Tax=Streptomyces omiyaensis TaxID=68247 RepID=UPI001672B342|nr:hypothetical protein [Streptomyces omiyaensis]